MKYYFRVQIETEGGDCEIIYAVCGCISEVCQLLERKYCVCASDIKKINKVKKISSGTKLI